MPGSQQRGPFDRGGRKNRWRESTQASLRDAPGQAAGWWTVRTAELETDGLRT